jgi:short subunit fatty acids transporter
MSSVPLSDTVQIVNALCNLAVALVVPYIAYLTLKQNQKAKEVAVKVAEVKQTLETKSETTEKKLDEIHVAVNGAMSSQMKISAVALRRVADLSKHADDIAAAELAEKTYQDHMSKQQGHA